jgi:hypothetical protein
MIIAVINTFDADAATAIATAVIGAAAAIIGIVILFYQI